MQKRFQRNAEKRKQHIESKVSRRLKRTHAKAFSTDNSKENESFCNREGFRLQGRSSSERLKARVLSDHNAGNAVSIFAEDRGKKRSAEEKEPSEARSKKKARYAETTVTTNDFIYVHPERRDGITKRSADEAVESKYPSADIHVPSEGSASIEGDSVGGEMRNNSPRADIYIHPTGRSRVKKRSADEELESEQPKRVKITQENPEEIGFGTDRAQSQEGKAAARVSPAIYATINTPSKSLENSDPEKEPPGGDPAQEKDSRHFHVCSAEPRLGNAQGGTSKPEPGVVYTDNNTSPRNRLASLKDRSHHDPEKGVRQAKQGAGEEEKKAQEPRGEKRTDRAKSSTETVDETGSLASVPAAGQESASAPRKPRKKIGLAEYIARKVL